MRRIPSMVRRSGAVTVELALVISLFFILVFAGIEFGRVSMLRHTAEDAAYEAARNVVVPGATVADAITQATDVVTRAGLRNAQVQVTPNPITETTNTVTVVVQIPVGSNSWVTPRWVAGSHAISGRSTQMTERITAIQQSAVPPAPP